MKTCTKCKTNKKLEEFSKRKASSDGLNHWCKSCVSINNKRWLEENLDKKKEMQNEWQRNNPDKRRNNELKNKYGITKEEYDAMLLSQNNKCKICNKEELSKGRSGDIRKMAVDHCHETNKIRGLLCAKCNKALGLLNDDIEVLNNAIKYLENNNGSI